MLYQRILVYILLILPFTLLAQNDQEGVTVSGIVKNSETGEVLESAVLHLHELNTFTITDVNGKFRFENVPSGRYHIHITNLGFAAIEVELIVALDDVSLNIQMKPSSIELEQVTVEVDALHRSAEENTLSVEIADIDYLERNYDNTFISTISKMPGISSINTGVGISKPVIRGMSFNRVIVSDRGIKQEGQQWGSDHGLEIDQFDIERLEIIKGPASLQYGSDAMAGVIRILPPLPLEKDLTRIEILQFYRSNNHAFGGSALFEMNKNDLIYKLRVSGQQFGDYRVPADSFIYNGFELPIENERLKNTAGHDYTINAGLSVIRPRLTMSFHLSNFHQVAGLFSGAIGIPRSYQLSDDGDRRNVEVPSQVVNHAKAIINTKAQFGTRWLYVDVAYQDNLRRELSYPHLHGNGPAPIGNLAHELRLQTWTLNAHLDSYYKPVLKGVLGGGIQYQINRRDGFEFLIPDFRTFQAGAYYFLDWDMRENLVITGGIRFDYGQAISDGYMQPIYSNDTTILEYRERAPDLNRSFYNVSGAAGLSWFPTEDLNLKLNIGRSFRMPTVTELAENGVHHGTFRHELGDSTLDSEIGYQFDLGLRYNRKKLILNLTPYFYYYQNFIYLRPTGFFSLLPDAGQIYQYTQASAVHTGFEFAAEYHPVEALHLAAGLDYVHNLNLETGLPLPFTPPFSLRTEIEYDWSFPGTYGEKLSAAIEWRYFATQNRTDRNEPATPGYHLLNLKFGVTLPFAGQELRLFAGVNNLLDTYYLNHLSRYRILNIPEQGRNFYITFKLPLAF